MEATILFNILAASLVVLNIMGYNKVNNLAKAVAEIIKLEVEVAVLKYKLKNLK